MALGLPQGQRVGPWGQGVALGASALPKGLWVCPWCFGVAPGALRLPLGLGVCPWDRRCPWGRGFAHGAERSPNGKEYPGQILSPSAPKMVSGHNAKRLALFGTVTIGYCMIFSTSNFNMFDSRFPFWSHSQGRALQGCFPNPKPQKTKVPLRSSWG